MNEPKKMDLSSMDVAAQKREELKQSLGAAFPEVFSEGLIDFDQLKRVLGEWVEPSKERFGLNWPGKAECMKVIQQPSVATLKPIRDESVNFDETNNVFIEGDNLEVLKLLQKSYFGKIKMVYIDPPYNTGKEFIYPDRYSESLETYLRFSGQTDDSGNLFSTNTETDGRFHSRWLNMMFTRIYLAKNLLREDGVLFLSIDDNELDNATALCNIVFGEENFLGCFVVKSTPNARDYGHIGKMHEYVIFYAKNSTDTQTFEIPSEDKEFRFEDATGGFNIHPLYNSNVAFHSGNRPNLYYPFYIDETQVTKDGFYNISLDQDKSKIEVFPPKSVKEGVQFVWRWGKDLSKNNLNSEIVGYKTNDGEFRIVQKMRHTSKIIRSLMMEKSYSSRRGTAEVEELFGKKIFSFPKPVQLIKDFIQSSTDDGDIILDFFAGSATTAHSMFEQCFDDKKNRRFILVQLPEPTGLESEAYAAGFKTISEIGRQRIRLAGKKYQNKSSGELNFSLDKQLDCGFRSFRLDRSNFKVWDAPSAKFDTTADMLASHINHIDEQATTEAILYELLLKAGFSLTTKVEVIDLVGKSVFSIGDGALLICLEKEITSELIDTLASEHPLQVICLDAGFKGNDQLKANAVQTFKARAQAEESEIVFRTV
jgi:adenine-specific DNA-methyltransferase